MKTELTLRRNATMLACTSSVLVAGTSMASPVAQAGWESATTRRVGIRQTVQDGPLGFAAIDAFPLYDACCYAGDFVLAQGQFMYVVLDVTNLSNRPHTFVADYQRLVDGDGRTYYPDLGTMALAAVRYSRRFLDIGPGSTTNSLLLFDVPKGTKGGDYCLSLHSSARPSTASVNLARGNDRG